MKKILLRSILFVFTIALFSCSSDDSPRIIEAFTDLDDFNTTEIETTIPRVEISQSGNEITLLLSVTDQDGTPLQKFTIGNYQVEVIVNGTTEIVANDRISLTELDEFSNSNPLAVATTLDYSGSMSSTDISDMELAIKSFINLKSTNDLVSIIKFASSVLQVQDFTTDTTLLNEAVDTNHNISGSTAFYSACELGLDKANELNNVLPLVIGFTDGFDNNSNINLSNLILKSQSLGIPIYTIGFGNAQQSNLQKLADDTGGRFYFAPNGQDIADLYKVINGQLKKLYMFNWNVNYPTGTEITIKITTEYTAANGTFTDVSVKTLVVR